MIRLFLLRHGNTFEEGQTPVQIGARTDLPLTATGRAQAERFAAWMKTEGINPQAIYRGPLQRHRETADILHRTFPIDIRPESCLNEIDYGPWEGLPAEEIARRWPQEYNAWNAQARWPAHIFPEASPLPALEKWLAVLRKNHNSGETLIAVSSNGLLRFFCALQKTSEKDQPEQIKVKTGHFCDLLLFPNRLEICKWNATV